MFIKKYNTIDSDRIPQTYNREPTQKSHPFVTGYWYISLIPPVILNRDSFGNVTIDSNNQSILVNDKIAPTVFNACADVFTPPTRTITKGEIVGFGGIKKYVITRQELSNTFSITFREYQTAPIYNLISNWTNSINQYTGKITKQYKGRCLVLLTKPTISGYGNSVSDGFEIQVEDIDELFYFEGVFPETDPKDKFSSDISQNDFLSLDINFSFDSSPMNKSFFNSPDGDQRKLKMLITKEYTEIIKKYFPHIPTFSVNK